MQHAQQYSRILVADEGRETGGMSEELFTLLSEQCPSVTKARVTGKDSFIPLGDAANTVLVSEAQILAAALEISSAPWSAEFPYLLWI